MQTIEEIYRARLRLLSDEAGSQKKLADRIHKSPAQISQWINASPDSKTGKPRAMDRETARHIERTFPKPEGWMDQPIDSPGAKVAGPKSSALVNQLDSWSIHASPRSREVIDQLRLLAQKNVLGDEDWDLIRQLAQRFQLKNRPPKT